MTDAERDADYLLEESARLGFTVTGGAGYLYCKNGKKRGCALTAWIVTQDQKIPESWSDIDERTLNLRYENAYLRGLEDGFEFRGLSELSKDFWEDPDYIHGVEVGKLLYLKVA